MRQHFVRSKLPKEMVNYTFLPKAPKSWQRDPNTWLTSVDIERFMKHYERSHPDFAFMGPSPIDFDTKQMFGECVWNELCHFNLDELLRSNVRKVGVIFNLDEHWEEGSHWTALFVDVPKKSIFYFDSTSTSRSRRINSCCKC